MVGCGIPILVRLVDKQAVVVDVAHTSARPLVNAGSSLRLRFTIPSKSQVPVLRHFPLGRARVTNELFVAYMP